MKIGNLTCSLLRIPFTFPLVKETQHALANFVELETDDGLTGHALSTYPMPHGVREFVNRGIRERQHRNAAAGSERRRDARNTRHDSSRLAGARARFDKRTPRMTCDGALLLRQIHASLIRAMA